MATRRARRAAAWIGEWLAMLAAWVLFTGTLKANELVLGALAAAVAATASHVVWSAGLAQLARHAGWLEVWCLPKYVVTGTVEIMRVLARQLFAHRAAASLTKTVAYPLVDEGDRAATRRALAVAYTTMTPNFVVVGIDTERGALVYHQIEASEIPEMTKRLGARP